MPSLDDVSASFGHGRAPLPSYAILIIGFLTLLCLALAAALVVAVSEQPAPDDLGTVVEVSAPAEPVDEAPAPSFGAEAGVVPTDLITRLEAASDGPIQTEMKLLLDAIQIGFGEQSVQLDPSLRTYAYRTSSRFIWEPDTFTVTVQAPTQDLAEARAATLSRLFETAIDAGRLSIAPAVGQHSLSLAS